MSRSAPYTHTPSPSCCRWNWKGGTGQLQWYDKNAKEDVIEHLPFSFLVLDRTATVVGYSKPKNTGMWSNEVKDTLSQPLVVRWQNRAMGKVAEGLWTDIKDRVKANSGKFCVNVWAAFRDPGDQLLKIGVIQMSGCALGPWIEFENTAGVDLYKQAVTINAGVETGDAIKFIPPVFALKPTKPETDAEALALDKKLQEWFTSYFAKPTTARDGAQEQHEAEPPPTDEQPSPEEEDRVPF